MPRSPRLYLEDILQAAGKIRDYTKGLTYERFAADGKTVDAVTRNLEVIGEASNRLPVELRDEHPRNRVEEDPRAQEHPGPRVFRR